MNRKQSFGARQKAKQRDLILCSLDITDDDIRGRRGKLLIQRVSHDELGMILARLGMRG